MKPRRPRLEKVGSRRVGPPRVGPRRVGGPKFRAFFFPLPPQFAFFSPSLVGPCVEFWWCLKRRGGQMCAFGVLGLSCEAPAKNWPKSKLAELEEKKKLAEVEIGRSRSRSEKPGVRKKLLRCLKNPRGGRKNHSGGQFDAWVEAVEKKPPEKHAAPKIQLINMYAEKSKRPNTGRRGAGSRATPRNTQLRKVR